MTSSNSCAPNTVSDSERSWRSGLHGLATDYAGDTSRRSWEELTTSAKVTAQAMVLACIVAQQHAAGAAARDGAALSVDAVSDWYESDVLRDDLQEALGRVSPEKYGDLDADQVVAQLDGMPPASLQGLMNGVQGSVLELRVDELFDSGDIPLAESAVDFELASRSAEAVDGYFFDSAGDVVDTFQQKVSDPSGSTSPRIPMLTESSPTARQLNSLKMRDWTLSPTVAFPCKI